MRSFDVLQICGTEDHSFRALHDSTIGAQGPWTGRTKELRVQIRREERLAVASTE
jgi:hypothetical protein